MAAHSHAVIVHAAGVETVHPFATREDASEAYDTMVGLAHVATGILGRITIELVDRFGTRAATTLGA